MLVLDAKKGDGLEKILIRSAPDTNSLVLPGFILLLVQGHLFLTRHISRIWNGHLP